MAANNLTHDFNANTQKVTKGTEIVNNIYNILGIPISDFSSFWLHEAKRPDGCGSCTHPTEGLDNAAV